MATTKEYPEKNLRWAWGETLAMRFLERHLPAVDKPSMGQTSRQAWGHFVMWCDEQGYPALSFQAFTQIVGPHVKRSRYHNQAVWLVGEDYRVTRMADPLVEHATVEAWIAAAGLLVADTIPGWWSWMGCPSNEARERCTVFVRNAAIAGHLAWPEYEVKATPPKSTTKALKLARVLLEDYASELRGRAGDEPTPATQQQIADIATALDAIGTAESAAPGRFVVSGPKRAICSVAESLGWSVEVNRTDVSDSDKPPDSQEKRQHNDRT